MSASELWPRRTTTLFVCRECLPAYCGYLPHVTGLIDRFLDHFLPQRAFEAACERGADTNTLEFLLANTAPDWSHAAQAAARGGHIHVLEWMVRKRDDRRGPWRWNFVFSPKHAAQCGRLEVLKWLDHKCLGLFTTRTMEAAAGNGQLEALQWLYFTHPESRSKRAIAEAAEQGRLHVIQWLHEYVPTLAQFELMAAATNGNLDVVEWLYLNRCRQDATAALGSASGEGHMTIVEWLVKHGAVVDPSSPSGAAGSGNLNLVKWFHEHYNAYFTSAAMDEAATAGHFEIVKWLHDNRTEGCTTKAMDFAASNARLDIVQWLHANRSEGCTTAAMDMAADYGHLEVLQWLHENRSEGCTDKATMSAALMGHVKVVRFLYDNHTNRLFGRELRDAADKGHFEMIQVLLVQMDGWNFESGYTVEFVIKMAVKKLLKGVRPCRIRMPSQDPSSALCKTLEAMKWFHTKRFVECVQCMLKTALKLGHLCLVQAFFEHNFAEKKEIYLEASKGYGALMRWLLEHGPPLTISAAVKVIRRYNSVTYVEMLRWLSESDRVQIVCEAISKKWGGWQSLLLWAFAHTTFEDPKSRRLIREAVQLAPQEMSESLKSKVKAEDVKEWCFSSELETDRSKRRRID